MTRPTLRRHRGDAKKWRRYEHLPSGLSSLITDLVTYAVPHFGAGSDSEESMALVEDRTPMPATESHVASSESRWSGRHNVLLDIDCPAWLVPSSSEGHSHLYVDLGIGALWADYEAFLLAAVKIGLIEDGYAKASIRRGHTALRLPWVEKGREDENDPPAEVVMTAEQYAAHQQARAAKTDDEILDLPDF